MNARRFLSLVVLTSITLLLINSPLRADDGPASLEDVHKILLQAAGDSADAVPSADQQKTLLDQALKEIHHLPHIYHGQLNQAARGIEAAMTELSSGDTAHKARNDILDADDVIKHIIRG